MDYMRIILNNALYLSLLLILLSSIIGVFLAGRKRDRCLKDFSNDECRLSLASGKTVYGILHTYGSGIELEYTRIHPDRQGHEESSFMLYSAESAQILTLKRFHHDLSEANRRERTREITRTYHPGFFRRARRKFRNFVNTFQDGLNRSLSTLIGAAAMRNPQAKIAGREKELSGLGSQMIGAVSHAYDAILEHYIGHYVVLEMPVDGEVREFCGILKDYTQNYIEILNLMERKQVTWHPLDNTNDKALDGLAVRAGDPGIEVVNHSDWPIYIQWVQINDTRIPMHRFLKTPETLTLPDNANGSVLSEHSDESTVCIGLIVPETLDMIVPRTLGVIRHGCPRSRHTLDTFLGLSSSDTVQNALYRQFVAEVNAQISSDPDETEHPD